MENINNEILNQLNQIRIELNFIKEAVSDGELTDWAKKELAEARAMSDSEMIPLEEVEQMILRK